jgi:hypothetical protein
MKRRDPKGKLSKRKAVDLMHRGSCLIKAHARRGVEFFVVPGGPVDQTTAEEIMRLPNVRGGKDSLWPGMDQTWRM